MELPPDPFAQQAPAPISPPRRPAWSTGLRLVIVGLVLVLVTSTFLASGWAVVPAALVLLAVAGWTAVLLGGATERPVLELLEAILILPVVAFSIYLFPILIAPLGVAALVAAASNRPILRTIQRTFVGIATAAVALVSVLLAFGPDDGFH